MLLIGSSIIIDPGFYPKNLRKLHFHSTYLQRMLNRFKINFKNLCTDCFRSYLQVWLIPSVLFVYQWIIGCDVVWFVACDMPVPHHSVELLHAENILSTIKERTFGSGSPYFSTHCSQTEKKRGKFKILMVKLFHELNDKFFHWFMFWDY